MKKTVKKFIDHMQNSDEEEKRIFAFWTSVLITGFIFMIWLVGFFTSINTNGARNEASPFKSIIEPFNEVINSTKEAIE